MQTPRHRTTGLALGVAAALAASASSDAGSSQAQDPEQLLRLAFSRRFDADLTSEIELVMRDRNGREHRRVFDAASKLIDGKHHSVGKLNWPVYLRDMTILTIEAEERDHDAFVYLPTLGRVRRISSSQKGDAFFGTDVTYEDLEIASAPSRARSSRTRQPTTSSPPPTSRCSKCTTTRSGSRDPSASSHRAAGT
jgi:hypothetical protein